MTFSSFSTGQNASAVQMVLGVALMPPDVAESARANLPFPQVHSQRPDRRFYLVFSGIAISKNFFTGPTTNTKNITRRFCVVVVMKRQHTKEVGYAIQR